MGTSYLLFILQLSVDLRERVSTSNIGSIMRRFHTVYIQISIFPSECANFPVFKAMFISILKCRIAFGFYFHQF
jgi:hypothetical protein